MAKRCLIFLGIILLAAIGIGFRSGWGSLQRLTPVLGDRLLTVTQQDLIAYEINGQIRLVTPFGTDVRQINRVGESLLGPWSLDGSSLAVLTGATESGEWLFGYPAVLDLKGNLMRVVTAEGPFPLEPGEMTWLPSQVLVAVNPDTVWIAHPKGKDYQAVPIYSTRNRGNERVWHPRSIPGSDEISFWVTSNDGEGCQVEASLVTLPISGGKPHEIFSTVIWAGSQAPVDLLWSPDGLRALVYAETSSKGASWWVVERSNGACLPVLAPEVSDPHWLDHGTLIYRDVKQNEYKRLDILNGKVEPWLRLPDWVAWLQLSPNRQMLLLARVTSQGRWDLYTAAADGSGITPLISGVGDAAWQPINDATAKPPI